MKPLPDQSVLQELLDYNPDTGELTWKPRSVVHFPNSEKWLQWNKRYANKPAFKTLTKNGYFQGYLFDKPYLSHRIAWKYVYGSEPDSIDHVDGNRINNKILNLRSVTQTENAQNCKLSKRNKSGQTGVSFCKKCKKWLVHINYNKKQTHLGWFKTFEEAVAARKAAEIQYGYHENHGRAA